MNSEARACLNVVEGRHRSPFDDPVKALLAIEEDIRALGHAIDSIELDTRKACELRGDVVNAMASLAAHCNDVRVRAEANQFVAMMVQAARPTTI